MLWSRRWLNQSTHPIVSYSTSSILLIGAVQERTPLRYRLGLEQSNCALRQSIVVGIPDATNGSCDPLEHKRFRERDRRILTRGAGRGPSSPHAHVARPGRVPLRHMLHPSHRAKRHQTRDGSSFPSSASASKRLILLFCSRSFLSSFAASVSIPPY